MARIRACGAHQQFTGSVRWHFVACVIDHAHLQWRTGSIGVTDAALTHVTRFAHRAQDAGTAGFRHRPALEQRHTESRLECRVMIRMDAAAHAVAQCVRAVERRGRRVEQHRGHHAEIVKAGGAGVDRVLPPLSRMEAIENDLCPAERQHPHERVAHRIHVEGRQRLRQPLDAGAQRDIALLRGVPLRPTEHVAVGDDAAFGPTGRARGVEQRAFGGFVDRHRARCDPCRRERRVIGIGDCDAECLRDWRHACASRLQHHRERALAVFQQIAELVGLIVRIDWNDTRPDRVEREIVKEERRPIFQQQRHAMTRAITGAHVAISELRDDRARL